MQNSCTIAPLQVELQDWHFGGHFIEFLCSQRLGVPSKFQTSSEKPKLLSNLLDLFICALYLDLDFKSKWGNVRYQTLMVQPTP